MDNHREIQMDRPYWLPLSHQCHNLIWEATAGQPGAQISYLLAGQNQIAFKFWATRDNYLVFCWSESSKINCSLSHTSGLGCSMLVQALISSDGHHDLEVCASSPTL